MKRLDDVLTRSNNNFDIVRLVAALMVVFGHSFALFKSNNNDDPVRYLLKDDYSGSLAVYVFFFLSGLFITSSFVNAKRLDEFIFARIFRIWPGLITCILLTVFLVGPVVTKFTMAEYFSSKITLRYLVRDITLHPVQFILPGVFEKNLYPNAVNGSLWTLQLEVDCYFMILLAGVFRVFENKKIAAVFFLSILVIYMLNLKSLADYFYRPVPFFLAGSFCYLIRRYIFIDYRIFIVIAVALFFFNHRGLFYVAWIYLAILLGSTTIFKKINLPGDYSYGIYIYGFLVQQLLSHYVSGLSAYSSMLISMQALILVGALSWHFIEFPFIKLGKRLAERFNNKRMRATEKNFKLKDINEKSSILIK